MDTLGNPFGALGKRRPRHLAWKAPCGCLPPSIALDLPPTLTHRVYLPLVMQGYGPDSPPPAACVAPFAVVRTTAGFQAAYDPNGNMIRRVEGSGTQRITYTQGFDAEGRLAVVTHIVTGEVVRLVYDGDGNRVLRIDGNGTTVTLGDYYEKRGETVTKYYAAGGQRIAVRQGGHCTSCTATIWAVSRW